MHKVSKRLYKKNIQANYKQEINLYTQTNFIAEGT